MNSIGDSLDLVPIASFHGRGKRVGEYGAFLLTCYDNTKDEYQTICKIGTGFSKAILEERSKSLSLSLKVIPKPKVWVKKKGISLRFPRLLRVREHKSPEEASSSEMVADMCNAQKHTKNSKQDDSEINENTCMQVK
ncbi:hypothetical protein L1987_69454 [Smallanthus sonchifolius]|uniref:Uncharacterized protein n=1 Tax=Smallanthus sonchifolius TaxID=185202 RepID=A0ACB9BAH8_9ASTR|nr:hypothetical protein L1987_69454 [Smallanthus sonchifolius]